MITRRPLLVRVIGGFGATLAWVLGLVLLFGSWLTAAEVTDPGWRVVVLVAGGLGLAILVAGLWWSMRDAASNLAWALGPWATTGALALLAWQVMLEG